ncbi:hypothetical protein DSL72_009164 [Monilinia vaccinii-corymbosi]|uniref:Inositol polyphosphate-related phosphatase domain-containing protein n=1 Tax=Monilinia vaccinii-corymbosi TaxID=61207 RepID=A0A8A3PNL5_9HELO|nr:hypothetical protein DSL72_009164 [Monilinia vaccinii-corymbosi]
MKTLSLYYLTFNCHHTLIDTDAFASQLFNGLSSPHLPDLLVLSLQEIAPTPHALIGGSFLVPYLNRFHHAVEKASKNLSNDGSTYTFVASRNVVLTGIMVFAKDPTLVQDLEAGEVGLGACSMGNKGAVGIRFTYGSENTSTELTFVAAHLAAMEEGLQRRNQDWKDIVRRLVFSSTTSNQGANSPQGDEDRPLLSISPQDASIYKSTSHLFFGGDLNYRTSIISPAPNDYIEIFPQPQDPISSPKHYSSLFENDQLNQERLAGRTCHGLIEAPISFPPTYKYKSEGPFMTSDDELNRWPWAKHRWPSWCDRILYLDVPSWVQKANPQAKIITNKYSALPLLPTSDHRAVALDVTIPLLPIPEPEEGEGGDDPRAKMPFDIDIDWKKKREKARMMELVVGFTLYFTSTKEGAALFMAMIVGGVGAIYVFKAVFTA